MATDRQLKIQELQLLGLSFANSIDNKTGQWTIYTPNFSNPEQQWTFDSEGHELKPTDDLI